MLVSTSIGEEGLDIGEVDFIIIYNCPPESIKAVSRGQLCLCAVLDVSCRSCKESAELDASVTARSTC